MAVSVISSTPKPVNGFKFVREQSSQPLRIAHGRRRAEKDSLNAIIDAVKEQIETTHAERFRFKLDFVIKSQFHEM